MERGRCFPSVFGCFIAWSCWSSFSQYHHYLLKMKQMLLTLMASCPGRTSGPGQRGVERVPCPYYPLGAPHILGIARVAEVTNIHPSTDIHIYAWAYKCTYMCLHVSWILRMCVTRTWVHECDMCFQYTHRVYICIYMQSYASKCTCYNSHNSRYIYIYITSITPVCHGCFWTNLRMGSFSVFGAEDGLRAQRAKVGVHWRWWFQWWICVKHDFQGFTAKRSKNMKIVCWYNDITWMWSCLKVILFLPFIIYPPQFNEEVEWWFQSLLVLAFLRCPFRRAMIFSVQQPSRKCTT